MIVKWFKSLNILRRRFYLNFGKASIFQIRNSFLEDEVSTVSFFLKFFPSFVVCLLSALVFTIIEPQTLQFIQSAQSKSISNKKLSAHIFGLVEEPRMSSNLVRNTAISTTDNRSLHKNADRDCSLLRFPCFSCSGKQKIGRMDAWSCACCMLKQIVQKSRWELQDAMGHPTG